MLSLCVTVLNRHPLFGNLERALRLCRGRRDCGDMEVVVSDWGSTDAPPLSWLRAPVTIVPLAGPFSRGRGLNAAANAARGSDLFFVDADMLLDHTVILAARTACRAGRAFFPVCWSFRDPEHTEGYWREEGFGITALPRELYTRAGRWDELTQWGSEDRMFHARVAAIAEIERRRQPGLYHQWHKPAGIAGRKA